MQWLAWSATLAGICLASGLGYFLVFNSTAEPVTVQTVAVETGTVENTIDESGTVELQGQRTIKSPTEGAVR